MSRARKFDVLTHAQTHIHIRAHMGTHMHTHSQLYGLLDQFLPQKGKIKNSRVALLVQIKVTQPPWMMLLSWDCLSSNSHIHIMWPGTPAPPTEKAFLFSAQISHTQFCYFKTHHCHLLAAWRMHLESAGEWSGIVRNMHYKNRTISQNYPECREKVKSKWLPPWSSFIF